METNTQDTQEQQKQDSNKIAIEYEKNLKTLVALFNGNDAFKKTKVPTDDVSKLVEEILKEKREEKLIEFKTKAKALLEEKVRFDAETLKLTDEFNKKILEKKKEFSKSMLDCFKIVEDIKAVETSYTNSLSSLKNEQ